MLLVKSHVRGWAGVAITPPPQTNRVTVGESHGGIYAPQTVLLAFPNGPAFRGGMREGDFVVSIGGADFRDRNALTKLDARVKRGDVVSYVVERGGKRLTLPVRFDTPMRCSLVVVQEVVVTVVAIIFLVIGFFVFSRKPDDRRVVVFFVLMLLFGVTMLGVSNVATAQPSFRGIAWDQGVDYMFVGVLSLLALATVPLTLHLALIFPRDRPIMRTTPHALGWVYGAPVAMLSAIALSAFGLAARDALLAPGAGLQRAITGIASAIVLLGVIAAAALILRRRHGTRLRAFSDRPIVTLTASMLAMVSICMLLLALQLRMASKVAAIIAIVLPALGMLFMPVLSFVSLFRSYREANVEERRQVTWPLWGLIIALGGRALVMIVNGGASAWVQATHRGIADIFVPLQYLEIFSRALYVLIPFSFAFSILKYRLMNIDVIIRKTVVYAILSGAIAVVYVVLVGGLGTLLLNATGVKNQTVIIASTLFVAILFVPLRNKLQTVVNRTLFRHRFEYPDALRAIAADALIATELAPFLGSAAEKIQQALQNRSVVVFAQRHDEHVATAKVGVSDTLLGTLRVHDAAIRETLDRPFDPRRRALSDSAANVMQQVEAVLVVPINTPGTPPNGFVTLGSKLHGAEFDVEDIDFLRSAADQLDIGIDRIRQQRDEADFAQARAIQQTLLPREMPKVAGIDVSGVWLPARDVGGDYFDVLKLGENELAVCIGDVAGKGMPAALLMSGLQASVRVSAFESRSPRELCERVRRVVVSSLSGGRFVTFFYAIVDTSAMRLRWCNAGHNAAILARADGSVVRLADGGPALSRLTRDQSFADNEIDLRAGDRLVLFTDGASEARDAQGEMFGETRLEELVATSGTATARDLQQTIVDAVAQFCRGEAEDDLTLVAVRI